MTQLLIAAFMVAAALAYSAWVLMPASWRRGAAARLARRAADAGLAQEHARAIQARLERAGGCSECASCKGCASSSPRPR
jgi:hypothetical protein